MNIDELIRRCSDEVMTQMIDECVIGASARRGFTELRIGTTGMTPTDLVTPDSSQMIGYVVWLPRDKVKTLMDQHNNGELDKS